MTAGERACRICERRLPLSEFQKMQRATREVPEYATACKPCHRAERFPLKAQGLRECMDCKEARPLEDFPRMGGSKRQYRKRRCLPCYRTYRSGLYKERDKAWRYKGAYGITLEDRDAMLAAQGGGCAICQRETPNAADWATDHDHACCPGRSRSCGKCIRGILCHSCNSALGLMGDSPETLARALEYLQAGVSRRMAT